MSQPKRSVVWKALPFVISFVLLGLAIWMNRDQVRQVIEQGVDGRLFALAFVFLLGSLLLTFTRWYFLVRALGLPIGLRDAWQLGFIGNLFNLVIPGAVGGDVIKGIYLCRGQARHSKTLAVASLVIDRIVGLLGLFSLAGLTGAFAWSGVTESVQRLIVLVWMAVAAGLIGLTVLFSPRLYRPINRLVATRRKLAKVLRDMEAMASAYRERIGVVALALVMSMAVHSCLVLAFYTVGRAMFASVPSLAGHFVIVPLVLFTTAVPLPFGALGVSEQASSELFKLVAHPNGAVGMMGFRVVMYAGGLLSALVYLANLRQVRTLQQEALAGAAEEPAAATDPSSDPEEDPLAVHP